MKNLNVIMLNGAASLGTGGSGGGVTINNQDKTVDITENGTTNVTADSEFTGLGKVTVNTAIPTEELNVDIDDVGTKTITPSKGYFSKVTVNTNIPLEDKVIDVTENGTMEIVPESGYFSKVVVNTNVEGAGGSSVKWTGHADAEGLRAIGWTEEDIAYYQEHGVNWNEEDDQYHLVSDDNKALYGVLTANNISSYRNRIVYLPKIDTSWKESMYTMFSQCYYLVAIPQLDTSKARSMGHMFSYCYSLVSIPPLDTSKVTSMVNMFYNCYSLASIPQLDTSNVTEMDLMFQYCYSLVSVPRLDTANVTNMSSMFYNCCSLVSIPYLDTQNVTKMNTMFYQCYSLATANLKNVKLAYQLNDSVNLRKESLLYIINNEASTSAITIKLESSAYTRLANDPDVVQALSNHPNISISA